MDKVVSSNQSIPELAPSFNSNGLTTKLATGTTNFNQLVMPSLDSGRYVVSTPGTVLLRVEPVLPSQYQLESHGSHKNKVTEFFTMSSGMFAVAAAWFFVGFCVRETPVGHKIVNVSKRLLRLGLRVFKNERKPDVLMKGRISKAWRMKYGGSFSKPGDGQNPAEN